MPSVNRQAIVPYSAACMYELVNDVESYPAFIPWCVDSKVSKRSENEVHACLEFALGKAGLHKSFTTCNRLQPNKMIEIRLLNGPFEHLEGMWRFQALDENSCHIFFDLEFKVAGKLGGLLFGPLFHQLTHMLIDAFCQRAEALYGKK